MEVIALDIGHSAVKVAAGDDRIIFPTAATPAVELGTAEANASAREERVRVNGSDYFVGHTAIIHTNSLLEGLRDDWIETDEHLALMVSGYQRGLAATGDADALLVMGLPSRLHNMQHARLAELAAIHLQIDKAKVSILPQPLGAFMAAALNENGEPLPGRNLAEERWGIIDVGFYTADFGLIESGVWSAAGAKSIVGANQMADDIRTRITAEHGVTLPLRDCDAILRAKSARIFGKVINLADMVDDVGKSYSRSIVENAITVFGARLPMLDGIIVAGGAAELVHPHLKADWPHAITATQPRFTVAEGMRRYGLMKQL